MCCTHQQMKVKEIEPDTIFVSYFPYDIETNVHISCHSMSVRTAQVETDTIILIGKDEYEKIANSVKKKQKNGKKNGCDSRIHVKVGLSEVCLGGIISCLCDIDENNIEEDVESIYLVKWKSGFFNYFAKEDLSYDETIMRFGLPKDYHQINPQKEIGNEVSKIDMIRKIALISHQ